MSTQPFFNRELANLIERMHADHEDEMDKAAVGYVLVSKDLQGGSLYIMGPFEEPEDAMAHSERLDRQLNTEDIEDGEGWELTVHRLMPPE